MQFLKVTLHFHLLQNTGYIPHVVWYIFEPMLHPTVCTSLLVITCLSIYLWVCFFYIIFTSLFQFLDSTYKRYHTVFIFFVWLISLSVMPSKSIHVESFCSPFSSFVPGNIKAQISPIPPHTVGLWPPSLTREHSEQITRIPCNSLS